MIRNTVRGRIIGNSFLILCIIATATLYTGLATSELARSVEILFRNNLWMENISGLLDNTETNFRTYLTTKSSDSLKDYIKNSTDLSDEAWKLSREIHPDELLLLERDLGGLIDDYLRETEAGVSAKRGRDVSGYADAYLSSERAAELSRFLIGRIQAIFISDSQKAFSSFDSQVSLVITTNAILVLAANFMGFMLLVRHSYALTEPLQRLAEAARAVGRGEYAHELPVPEKLDEIGTTAAAFASMQESIRLAFAEIRSKSEVERRFMEERVRVLDMGRKLKEAELLALQTQINPHFLFNTLSAGLQLAMVEGADRTRDFLENLSEFIRYVLKPPSRLVKISDEIECVERYIWLLRLRFGTRYSFSVTAQKEILNVETPALVLQPLVENAVAHGLKNREEGGTVHISTMVEDDVAVLCVEDSGDGMSDEEVARVMHVGSDDASLQEGGIGLRNVIRRVSLVTGDRGTVELEGRPGKGTIVRIRLPRERYQG